MQQDRLLVAQPACCCCACRVPALGPPAQPASLPSSRREEALLTAGFRDIFQPIKQRENQQALALLPGVCAEVDGLAGATERWEIVLRGVFAGWVGGWVGARLSGLLPAGLNFYKHK